MATSSAANAERFLADRAAPLCSMDIADSFEQLRKVLQNMDLSINQAAPNAYM